MLVNKVWIFRVSFLSISLIFILPQAHATKIAIVGAGEISSIKTEPSNSSLAGIPVSFSGTSKQGYGFGALLGMALGPVVEFESGALFINRKYQLTSVAAGATQNNNYSQSAVQIPLLLRLNLGNIISVGAGGYIAVGTGNVVDRSDGGISGQAKTTTSSYGAESIKNKDYGVLGSVAINFPIAPLVSILLDGRYIMDLSNVEAASKEYSPPISRKYRDTQILLGLQFGLR